MASSGNTDKGGILRGVVYGDLIGAPYRIENTYNRYFPLGETRRIPSHGKLRVFFPEATEVTHGAAAVCRWLSVHREHPTAEALQRALQLQFHAHPRGGWTEPTRLFLTSGRGLPSEHSDWAAVARCIPIAPFTGEDLFAALELAEACVRATCSDEETIRMAQAVTHAVHMARHGAIDAEIFTTMEMQYGLNLSRRDEDLRSELRGEQLRPLELMGAPVPGAYHYVMPESPVPPSARLVTEAALRAVTGSDSWEDAVRRAVAYGGPSNALAGIAGGVAEALYGEVTPSIMGQLFPYIPTDVTHEIEASDRMKSVSLGRSDRPYEGMVRCAFTLYMRGNELAAVVPRGRNDMLKALEGVPGLRVITPEEKDAFLGEGRETREGTYPYGTITESMTCYLQEGTPTGTIALPETFVAPGMPPLQERRRNVKAFESLRSFCIEVQQELNRAAGNPDAGQIHYGGAFHLWIGRRRIDFFFGDSLAGRVSLTERALLKVDLGDYRDLSEGARFENHREQAWASRSVFTIAESSAPLSYLDEIRSSIRERLLDDGERDGLDREADSRYLKDEDRAERSPVSNIDHLERCEERGIPPLPIRPLPFQEVDSERRQEVVSLFSIGYGMRSPEGLVNTLRMLDVDTVVDVRSSPRSRFRPQFDADTIYGTLQEGGIAYFTAGDRLGERPSDPSLYDRSGRVDWEALRESEGFGEAIASIRKLASEGHLVAILSAEGDPLCSHRFGVVARALEEEGMKVSHILPNGELVRHSLLAARMVEEFSEKGLIPGFYAMPYDEQLQVAYKVLNREKGFKLGHSRAKGFHAR